MSHELRAVPTHNNELWSVNQSPVDFARKNLEEMPRMPGDPGYGICICGGQGDCLGCEELEVGPDKPWIV